MCLVVRSFVRSFVGSIDQSEGGWDSTDWTPCGNQLRWREGFNRACNLITFDSDLSTHDTNIVDR